MKYPIAINHDKDSAYGVAVPDIPGCFSAGDTLDDAFEAVQEAIGGHLSILFEDGQDIPVATTVENFVDDPGYAGAQWAYVDVDISRFSGKTKKENVTLPINITAKIDDLVKQGKAKNRSAFLAEAAAEKLARAQQ